MRSQSKTVNILSRKKCTIKWEKKNYDEFWEEQKKTDEFDIDSQNLASMQK